MSSTLPSHAYMEEGAERFWVSHFVAGAMSGVAGIVVGHPFDTSKVRMQAAMGDAQKNNRNWGSTWGVVVSTIKHEGVRGLYRGMGMPLVGEATIGTFMFGIFGTLQRWSEPRATWYSPFVNGSIVGFLSSFITSPIELVKIRLQIQTEERTKQQYKGPIDMLQKAWRLEGRSLLLSGLTSTWLRDIPSFAAYFGCYEIMKKYAAGADGHMSPAMQIAVGGAAGCASWIPVYPIDVIKTRVQEDKMKQYRGFVDCLVKVVRSEGWRPLGRGFWPTILRSIPVNAAVFYVYEFTKRLFDSSSNNTPNK